jgi:hypothetical protein
VKDFYNEENVFAERIACLCFRRDVDIAELFFPGYYEQGESGGESR